MACLQGEEDHGLERQGRQRRKGRQGEGGLCMHDACRIYPQTDWPPQAKRPVDKRGCHWTVCVWGWNPKLAPAAYLNNNTSLFDLTHKTMSVRRAWSRLSMCPPHMFGFVTPHLHLNAKSAGFSVCASREAGDVASGNGDEQTLQGRIISYYPQSPDAALRWWAQPDSSHGQKWVESLSRFIRPSQTPCPLPPPLLPPCLPASNHPSVSSAAHCLPYALNLFCYLDPHTVIC